MGEMIQSVGYTFIKSLIGEGIRTGEEEMSKTVICR